MTTQKPSDFVQVQLSAAGIAFAAGGAVRISTAHFSYEFKPGTQVRVLTSEWSGALSRERISGETIFELVPAPADATPSTAAAPAPVEAESQTKAPPAAPAAAAAKQKGN